MRHPWPLYSISELAALPRSGWLIDGHLTDGFTVLHGEAGPVAAVALAWALAIATGTPWNGNGVREAPVLYVSGEGRRTLDKRISSWESSHTGRSEARLYLILDPVVLADRGHVESLREDIFAAGAEIVIIDDLSRSMPDADENSTRDMGLVVNAADVIRRETGCATLLAHHSGPGERLWPSGSPSLLAAADTLICVQERHGAMDLICEKQKESPPFRPVRLGSSA